MADERRSEQMFQLSELNKPHHPPPAHLTKAVTPPPPPGQMAHLLGMGHTPPPAHVHDLRSSPGLSLMAHLASSPQMQHFHQTPSPHNRVSPGHILMAAQDRTPNHDPQRVTPPRPQVFPHAGVQQELLRVLRPGIGPLMQHGQYNNNLPPVSLGAAIAQPQHIPLSSSHQMMAAAQQAAMQQQQQQHQRTYAMHQMQLNNMQHVTEMQQQQRPQVSTQVPMSICLPTLNTSLANHRQSNNGDSGSHLGHLYQQYNDISPPEPSPHQELKLLAKIASSELMKGNSPRPEMKVKREPGEANSPPPDVKPYNQRIKNLNNFPSSSPYASSYRSRSIAMQRAKASCITSSAKSLDILRQVMQNNINDEVHAVLDKYIKSYFRPALENIRGNNGETSVSEEHIQCICRKILEEATRMYMGGNTSGGSGMHSRSMTPDIPDNLSDAGSITSDRRGPRLPFSHLKKRPASDTDSDASGYHRRRTKKSKGVSGLVRSNETVKRDGPKWNPERLTPDTQFIMGAKANKALGLGATRGRLYIKHPAVFKYSGDQDDKQWLYENNRMPATGGKAYMLLLDDIVELANSDEYRSSSLLKTELKGFTVPPWMIQKIKLQMQSLSDTMKPRPKALLGLSSEVYDADSDKNVPFTSAASSRKSLSDTKMSANSPANTEELELLSSEEQEEQPVSPFDTGPGGLEIALAESFTM